MRHPRGVASPAVALVATLALLQSAAPAGAGDNGNYAFCPPARTTSASHLHWAHHRLAPGVTLASSTMRGDRGKVEVRVLRVDLTHRGVSVAPLHGALASGRILTSLAATRKLVAATNGMYFNLSTGSPKVPFVSHRRPMVLSDRPARVAGIGVNHRAQDGDVWLDGTVRSGDAVARLSAVNLPFPPRGLSVYTGAWGRRHVPLKPGVRSREVRHGRVVSGTGRHPVAPRGGRLLVAHGRPAVHWLRSLRHHARVSIRLRVATDAPVRFEQAYGVGTHTVSRADQINTGLYCSRHEYYAARTGIAWTRSRSTLMLVTAVSPRGPDHHGLDENQMSALLVHLRAAGGYALDGGYSTGMVVRLPHHHRHRLTQVAGHHHRQRRIPVGVGVFYRR
ncbi:MAG TPA: phosphodiester glycosidase family protein [Mycobacteriales bacterium]|nr:phosphodiester glycosidase family protein [Mycobacteriales bacterium]